MQADNGTEASPPPDGGGRDPQQQQKSESVTQSPSKATNEPSVPSVQNTPPSLRFQSLPSPTFSSPPLSHVDSRTSDRHASFAPILPTSSRARRMSSSSQVAGHSLRRLSSDHSELREFRGLPELEAPAPVQNVGEYRETSSSFLEDRPGTGRRMSATVISDDGSSLARMDSALARRTSARSSASRSSRTPISPVSSRIAGQSIRRLSRDVTGGFRGLDELEGPAPVQDVEQSGGEVEMVYFEDQTPPEEILNEKLPVKEKFFADFMPMLTTACWLIFFSIFGALARVGLQALTVYPGSPLSGVIWAQFAGCVVMGFMAEEIRLFAMPQHKTLLRRQNSRLEDVEEEVMIDEDDPHWGIDRKSIPLFIGITTGFCGSLTSFSSWMRDIFFAMSDTQPQWPRGRGDSFQAVCSQVITTLCISIGAVTFGAHIAIGVRPYLVPVPVRLRPQVDRVGLFLGPACWLGIILMSVFIPKWRGKALFAGVFGPVGAYMRFWLSKHLNPLFRSFPMGTYTANTFGTMVLAVGIVTQRLPATGFLSCQVLQGIEDGFCGALTTVSTFVMELKGLRRRNGYVYGGASIITGTCLMIAILGSYTWSHGLDPKKC